MIKTEKQKGVEEEGPLPKARMIPDPKRIKIGGRANPPGLAYLYLANRPETALAEMRPWIGGSVTLAVFEIKKDIELVLCQTGAGNPWERLLDKRPSAEEFDNYVWYDISRAFGRPVSQEDQERAYVPTQILAEAFKAEGYDGLAYCSGLERGTNIVLFDVRAAKLICRFVYTLQKVHYDFHADPNHAIPRKNGNRGGYKTEYPHKISVGSLSKRVSRRPTVAPSQQRLRNSTSGRLILVPVHLRPDRVPIKREHTHS